MRKITNYKLLIEDSYISLKNELKKINIKKALVITDKTVYELYFNEIYEHLKDQKVEINELILEPGESSKSIENVLKIYKACLGYCLDRSSAIIALGGGVIGDISGFAASSYMRGIKLINLPTTLLSQVDSSIGGKNSINFMGIKNIIGTFFNPSLVYINPSTLTTLSNEQFLFGLSEVIKYGIIYDSELFYYINQNLEKLLNRDGLTLKYIIKSSCRIKMEIVSMDEKDEGIRNILNFGHTLGHAIESVSDFKIEHGEAVAYGMIMESTLALKMKRLGHIDYDIITNLISRLYDISTIRSFNTGAIMDTILKDKKNKDNRISCILPINIGKAIIETDIPKDLIIDIIEEFC